MDEEIESYFVPYEESGYPEREKQMKDLAQENQKPLPENYTLKKCEAYIRPDQTCKQPATWVRMTPNRRFGYTAKLAVCDEHKNENGWTSTAITAKSEREIRHEDGSVLYFLTVQDDIVGEFRIRVWLNHASGSIIPMIADENPSPWLKQIREQAEKRGIKW